MTRFSALLLPLVLAAAGCSSTSSGEVKPSIEEEIAEAQREGAENRKRMADPKRLLLALDQALDTYVQFVHQSGSMRMDGNAEKMADYLQQRSLENFDVLLIECNHGEFPRNRAIAAAALGFSGRDEALDPLLNAAASEDDEVAANAILGLAVLGHDPTPPGAMANVILDENRPEEMRAGAAWALHEIQLISTRTEPIIRIWVSVLTPPIDTYPPGVYTQAIRGVGLTRDPQYRELVERFVSHPTTMVRWSTAIALGRFGSTDAVPALLALLGPAEHNSNVRLSARKALSALAGGMDVGYDVEEWLKVFDYGQ